MQSTASTGQNLLALAGCDASVLRPHPEDPQTVADWNEQLRGIPDASIFHTAEWASVLAGTYGFQPAYLTVRTRSQIDAVLPLMEVNSWITGRRGVSLPFTDRCDVASSLDAPSPEMNRRLLAVARARKWRYIELRGESALDGFAKPEPSLSFYRHTLPLAEDSSQNFARFAGSVRRAIRKAKQAGLEVDISSNPDALREYYALHCKTRRRHGLPPQPFRFFRQIGQKILSKHMGAVVSARRGKQIIASAVFLLRGPEAVYKFGASDADYFDTRANNLVMWEAICWLKSKGARVLDFGRTSMNNSGLRRFKLGWGADEQLLHYYKFDVRQNVFISAKDNTEGWHTRMFQVMPTVVGRWAGAALYKHIG